MTMSRLDKIRSIWSDDMLQKLPGVPMNVSSDEIFERIVACDPTPQKKMLSWLLYAWQRGGFLWEDIFAGAQSTTGQTLYDFERLKKRITLPDGTPDIQARSLMKYRSPGQVWTAIRPYLEQEAEQGLTISGKEEKRIDTLKGRLEAAHVELPSGLKIDIPLTVFSSKILGRNTKWCTAADNGNMFQNYSESGPLFVLTLPDSTRFQAHYFVNDTEFEREVMHPFIIQAASEISTVPEGQAIDAETKRRLLSDFNPEMQFSFMNEADTHPTEQELKKLSPYLTDCVDFISQAVVNMVSPAHKNEKRLTALIADGIRQFIETQPEKKTQEMPQASLVETPIDVVGLLVENGCLVREKDTLRLQSGQSLSDFRALVCQIVETHIKENYPDRNSTYLSRKEHTNLLDGLTKLVLDKQVIQEIEALDRKSTHLIFDRLLIDTMKSCLFNKGNIKTFLEVLDSRYQHVSRKNIISIIDGWYDKIGEGTSSERLNAVMNVLPELMTTKTDTNLFWSWIKKEVRKEAGLARCLEILIERNSDMIDGQKLSGIPDCQFYYGMALQKLLFLCKADDLVNRNITGDMGIPYILEKMKITKDSPDYNSVMLSQKSLIMKTIKQHGPPLLAENFSKIFRDIDKSFPGVTQKDIANEIGKGLSSPEMTPFHKECILYMYNNFESEDILPEFERPYRDVIHSVLGGGTPNFSEMDNLLRYVRDALDLDESSALKLEQHVKMSNSLLSPQKGYLEAISDDNIPQAMKELREEKKRQNVYLTRMACLCLPQNIRSNIEMALKTNTEAIFSHENPSVVQGREYLP